MDVLQTLSLIGIVPVIAIDDADKAVDLARALTEGGLPAAEITFRTAAGQEAIKRVAKECPEVLVGAGTVLTVEQCDRAIEAGARFIVSPGYYDEVVNHCVERGIPVLPGCSTPSDMTKAVNAGLKTVKFFPAEASGGIAFLKSVAPVFPLTFMPTGGVNTANLLDYVTFDRIASCGGTWMVKKDLINAGKFEEITAISREAVKTMLGFELRHVGINCEKAEEAEKTAKTIAALFGFAYKPGNSSDFAGEAVECMKQPYLGTNGHIAIGTNSVDRAVYHLGLQGIKFDEATRKTDAKGKTKAIYLKGEFGGFAIHLVQK
ncbi:MAG: bifunctional 4-hydroxy-2-oxoglutarate aldolase/2-dehydro-3-deoxy-phosphogluconate aldolase [Lachnospiraceae bacterium]|nr:bifunctional 4-hydroxy-2-oxoglutarate aldolase/2-dehydro-3-deoxy-phosphogluconate aldolase [Lachnospiraceae bacterium]